ncbi:MAG: dickkopf-related protein, partial [Bradymonadaceae bacterium]
GTSPGSATGASPSPSGCRLERPNCPSGQRCWQVTETTGQCLNRCTAHRDCPHGQYCDSRDGNSVCRPEPPCDSDEQCIRSDEVCRNGSCRAPPCQSNEDCPPGQACDRATGLCVGGDCSEDSFAPNQTRAEATGLDFETYTGLQLCPGRSDWFSLQVESAESIAIRLEHPAESDVDMSVFGGDGDLIALNQQAPTRDRGPATATVAFVAERAQTIDVRIYTDARSAAGTDGDEPAPSVLTSASYKLTVERAEDLLCQDDRSEENDVRSEAEQLPSQLGSAPAYPFLKICGGDTDWFRLPDIRRRAQLDAQLRNAPSHIELEILSEQGRRFVRRPNDAFHLWRNPTQQNWYFRVASTRQASAGYNLTYAIEVPWECPRAGAHSDAASARSVAPEQRTTFLLCPADPGWEDDWIALDTPTSDTYLELHVFEKSGSPPLEVTVFERKGDPDRRHGLAGSPGREAEIRDRL